MAPLVLHNVPDDELYIGADGVTRPFAVVGAADEYVEELLKALDSRSPVMIQKANHIFYLKCTGGDRHGYGDKQQPHTGHSAGHGHDHGQGRLAPAARVSSSSKASRQ
ncbi:uncharacterized protein SPSK_06767 [Sporothrix schenckii 1099-18]|uniref:Uncharacterized protein n=1 Tax=Sporothrix schenckii 1099-18 TaxID=1397361 RepID=A0A0F2MKD1_SPOSC|nr:uncharacterized protein SPSK_06767 [Sporothrix schenckii 1099-18]KJR89509.1 hypothetical protein SPSK_06767 [Sporothrix schenckii 1099-18]